MFRLFIVFLILFSVLDSIANATFVMSTPTQAKYRIEVDFRKPSTAKRLCVIEIASGKSVYCTEVAHGKNSGGLYARYFSNTVDSLQSSLGTFRLRETYIGKHGLSIKLEGLDGTNSNTARRYIVIHEASYIGHGQQGRSWGCFAIPVGEMKNLLKYYQKGMELRAYK